MTELSILPAGEVKLGCETVGRITWATGSAYMDVSGVWEREGEGSFRVTAEEWDELVDERDDLADDLAERDDAIRSLRKALAGIRQKAESAICNIGRPGNGFDLTAIQAGYLDIEGVADLALNGKDRANA